MHRGIPCLPLSTLISISLSMLGCASVMAPPVRTPLPGTPGELARGDVEAGVAVASAVSADAPNVTAPFLAHAISDRLSIEGAGDMGFAYYGDLTWGIGSLGVRYSPTATDEKSHRHELDVGIGGGLGRGGFLYGTGADECTDDRSVDPHTTPRCLDGIEPDGRPPLDRIAGGGYLGVGYGYRWKISSVYLRVRYQLTAADNIPATHWLSGVVGLQVRIGGAVRLFFALGEEGYVNRGQYAFFPCGQLGLSFILREFGDGLQT